jgi:protein gp37
MASVNTSIEWTDATWGPTRGCSRVDDDGCRNCYAMRFAHRFSGPGQPYEGLTRIGKRGVDWAGHAKLVPDQLEIPLKWRKPRRIFVDSMSDLFHESLPFEHIAAVFGVMHAAMDHTFQVLTKRPRRALEFANWLSVHGGLGPYIRSNADALRGFFDAVRRIETVKGRRARSLKDPWMQVFNAAAVWSAAPLLNVWLGVSVSNQANADERIPLLLQCPAAVRFVSYEPALGPIDFDRWLYVCEGPRIQPCESCDGQGPNPQKLDWIIVGGESGNGARPFWVPWARSVKTQCAEAGVALFVKQLGAHPWVTQLEDMTCWATSVDVVDDLAVGPSELLLNDRKGGDWLEWPKDLRVREFPEVRS